MGDRLVGITDTPSAAGIADIRTRERTVGGNTVDEQYVIPINERVASYKGIASTFRTPGRAAVAQPVFSIMNTAGSAVLVAVRRLSLQMDTTAVLLAVARSFKLSRITAAANGTAAAKTAFDSSQSSAANVEIRGDASADGTSSGTALTHTGFTAQAWTQLGMRQATAVGQIIFDDEPMVPHLSADDPIILRAGEGLGIAIAAAATTSNPVTDFHVINVVWEEFTLP